MPLERKFTTDEINDLMFSGGIYDEDNELLFEVVQEEFVDSDIEKGSVTKTYVIQDMNTGLYFRATLSQSPWIGQDRENVNAPWVEVHPVSVMVTKYEEF